MSKRFKEELKHMTRATFAHWVGLTTRQVINLEERGLPVHRRPGGRGGSTVEVDWHEAFRWYIAYRVHLKWPSAFPTIAGAMASVAENERREREGACRHCGR